MILPHCLQLKCNIYIMNLLSIWNLSIEGYRNDGVNLWYYHICIKSLFKHACQRTKIFQYCTCPAGRVTYNFHLSCKHMHLSFKSVNNKEHKGVICTLAFLSNSSQSTRPLQDECFVKNYSSFLDFTRNYERTSGIFVPCMYSSLVGLEVSLLVCDILCFTLFVYAHSDGSQRLCICTDSSEPSQLAGLHVCDKCQNLMN